MKVVLIGAVSSSSQILKKLIEYKFDIIAVFGHEPDNPQSTSGHTNMRETSKKNHISYYPFKKINNKENIDILNSFDIDLIFAVGFSQLISKEIISIPILGCIGFHPTKLPDGRGRGAIAWLILHEKKGAATFFHMGEGMDDGPIFVQQEFDVSANDNANTIRHKILESINIALDKWLPELKKGKWNPIPQDESLATYHGKRNPIDGWVNWNNSAIEIDKLIRATTSPYPGAFSFYKDSKLIIWKCLTEHKLKIIGVPGRVLLVEEDRILVQTGKGLIWLLDFELQHSDGQITKNPKLKVGEKIGYNVEYEIYKLKNNIIK